MGRHRHGGFTLVEAMVGLSVLAFAGAVMLLAMESSLDSSQDNLDRTIAAGLARQVVDEVVGSRYRALGAPPQQYPLGPSSWEIAGHGRERFDDTDDYANQVAEPAANRFGQPLGQGDDLGGIRHPDMQADSEYFNRWRIAIDVYYVADDDHSRRLAPNLTSHYRAVEVTVQRRNADDALLELARSRRVFTYVPGS